LKDLSFCEASTPSTNHVNGRRTIFLEKVLQSLERFLSPEEDFTTGAQRYEILPNYIVLNSSLERLVGIQFVPLSPRIYDDVSGELTVLELAKTLVGESPVGFGSRDFCSNFETTHYELIEPIDLTRNREDVITRL